MKPFFLALKGEPATWRDFWLLCLFSGTRRGNVASMTWAEVDLNAGVWYLAGQKTENGLPVAIALPPPTVNFLLSRRADREPGEVWVSPAPTKQGHVVDPRNSWARVLKRSKIENLRPHDLRRPLVPGRRLPGRVCKSWGLPWDIGISRQRPSMPGCSWPPFVPQSTAWSIR
jgi:integrase